MADSPDPIVPEEDAAVVYETIDMLLERDDLTDADAHMLGLVATSDKPGVNTTFTDRTVSDARWVAFERQLDELGWPYEFTAWPRNEGSWAVSYLYAADDEWFAEHMFGYEMRLPVERMGSFYGYDERDVEYFTQCDGMVACIVRKWMADNFDSFDATLDDMAYLEFVYNVIEPTEERLYEAIETGKERYERLLDLADAADSDALRDSVETYLEHERDSWERTLDYDDETWEGLLCCEKDEWDDILPE